MSQTMHELWADDEFRAWMLRIPRKIELPSGKKPWRLYVQREEGGRWAIANFLKYEDAVQKMVKMLRAGAHDAAVNCPSRCYRQPWTSRRWSPGQDWCGYCRRPVRFKVYKKHHALPPLLSLRPEPRCEVCGIRQEIATAYAVWR